MTEQIYTPQDVETIVAVLKLIREKEPNKAPRWPGTLHWWRLENKTDEEQKRIVQELGEIIARQIEKAFWGK